MLRMSALAPVTFKLVCDRQAPPYVQTQETVIFKKFPLTSNDIEFPSKRLLQVSSLILVVVDGLT